MFELSEEPSAPFGFSPIIHTISDITNSARTQVSWSNIKHPSVILPARRGGSWLAEPKPYAKAGRRIGRIGGEPSAYFCAPSPTSNLKSAGRTDSPWRTSNIPPVFALQLEKSFPSAGPRMEELNPQPRFVI
jgi:hypothetical protein